MKPASRSDGFRRDPKASDVKDLNRFLRPYGLTKSLNDIMEDGEIDLEAVIGRLPAQDEDGINPAHRELKNYYDAIPLRLRAEGIYLSPDAILTRLMSKMEFHHDIGEGLVRMCNGFECVHYEACPFKELVTDNKHSDGMECMVDREVVNNTVNAFLHPENGKPKVDPGRPAMALLFEQLVQQLVRVRRISMTMQVEDVTVRQLEILRDGDKDFLEAGNMAEHPLMKTWDNAHKRIEKLMKAMGITPEFEIRHDLWETKDERQSADERSKQLLLERLEDTLRAMKESEDPEQLNESATRGELLQEALMEVRKQTEQQS